MKPRLKLSNAGTLSLVAPGITGLNPHAMRQLIWRHYGSLAAFAKRFSIRYDIVCAATAFNTAATGGKIDDVRALLGLPARPSKRALKRQARVHFARRPTKASAPEAPEAQSASAKAGTAGTPTEARV